MSEYIIRMPIELAKETRYTYFKSSKTGANKKAMYEWQAKIESAKKFSTKTEADKMRAELLANDPSFSKMEHRKTPTCEVVSAPSLNVMESMRLAGL